MKKQQTILLIMTIILCSAAVVITQSQALADRLVGADEDGPVATGGSADGYVIQRDKDVARDESGPHDGGGPSTGYIFFEKVPDLKFSFRKRVLHRGAAIGVRVISCAFVDRPIFPENGPPLFQQPARTVSKRIASRFLLLRFLGFDGSDIALTRPPWPCPAVRSCLLCTASGRPHSQLAAPLTHFADGLIQSSPLVLA